MSATKGHGKIWISIFFAVAVECRKSRLRNEIQSQMHESMKAKKIVKRTSPSPKAKKTWWNLSLELRSYCRYGSNFFLRSGQRSWKNERFTRPRKWACSRRALGHHQRGEGAARRSRCRCGAAAAMAWTLRRKTTTALLVFYSIRKKSTWSFPGGLTTVHN